MLHRFFKNNEVSFLRTYLTSSNLVGVVVQTCYVRTTDKEMDCQAGRIIICTC